MSGMGMGELNSMNMGDLGFDDLNSADLPEDAYRDEDEEEVEGYAKTTASAGDLPVPSVPSRKEGVSPVRSGTIELPSFFDLPAAKSLGEFLDKAEKAETNKEGTVHLDMDNEDPVYVAQKIKEVYNSANLKAALCEYIEERDFRDVGIEDLFTSPLIKGIEGSSPSEIKETVKRLIFNTNLKSKKDFLRKLYKLRDIEDLISDSLQFSSINDKFDSFKKNLRTLIGEYEESVRDSVAKTLAATVQKEQPQKPAVDAIAQMRFAESEALLQEELKIARAEVEGYKKALEEKISASKKTIDSLVESNKVLEQKREAFMAEFKALDFIDDEDDEDVIIAKIMEELKGEEGTVDSSLQESLEFEIEKAKGLEDEISELKEDNGRLKDENSLLSEKVESLSRTIEEIHAANAANSSQQPQESDDEEEGETDKVEVDKKESSNKAKKVGVIIGGVLFTLLAVFLIGDMFMGEESPAPTAYAVAPATAPKTADDATAAVVAHEAGAAVVVPDAPPAGYENVFDFTTAMGEEEFKKQAFDIYREDFNKIRINQKDFISGDVINGYKFIKATSAGKILFIKSDNEPMWVEMK
ncbi:MAG: hypothetical protein QG567_730 [Campylobacterota bacterium]|nr:hypothetical protein [Campylobacterota bacterium]MDQ1339578.1 hypothetical protein [Campylobacterota bacterium]